MKSEKGIESAPEIKEGEKRLDVIVDFIRHGETTYKELKKEGRRPDPSASDFKFDEEHLDLTEEGIKGIKETAEQLAKNIDKENEAVFLITSPSHRAYSSILLIENAFQEKGISILNPANGIEYSPQLEEIRTKDQDWEKHLEITRKYHEDPSNAGKSPDIYHAEIASILGKDFYDIFEENYDQAEQRFQEFFRHVISPDEWLTAQQKKSLENKKIRLVCLTHGGVSSRFLRYFFEDTPELQKGQILEIRPGSSLENRTIATHAILYGKKGSPQKETDVSIKFSLNELEKEELRKK